MEFGDRVKIKRTSSPMHKPGDIGIIVSPIHDEGEKKEWLRGYRVYVEGDEYKDRCNWEGEIDLEIIVGLIEF